MPLMPSISSDACARIRLAELINLEQLYYLFIDTYTALDHANRAIFVGSRTCDNLQFKMSRPTRIIKHGRVVPEIALVDRCP
jgi:hypothetical protein